MLQGALWQRIGDASDQRLAHAPRTEWPTPLQPLSQRSDHECLQRVGVRPECVLAAAPASTACAAASAAASAARQCCSRTP